MALMTMQISCQKIMFFYVSIIFELKSGKLLNSTLINIFCKAVARKVGSKFVKTVLINNANSLFFKNPVFY